MMIYTYIFLLSRLQPAGQLINSVSFISDVCRWTEGFGT